MKTREVIGVPAAHKNNYPLWARRCLLKCQRGVGGARRDAFRIFQLGFFLRERDREARTFLLLSPFAESFSRRVETQRAVFIAVFFALRNSTQINPEIM